MMAKTAKRFQYQKRERDDVKTRANMRGGGFDSIIKPEYKRYKIRDGKNLIRIMPPTWQDAKHYGYDIFVNYGIGPDNQSYLSLGKMNGEFDPLAEARRQAQKEGREKLAKALNPSQRVLMWIIDRQDEDEGPQLWDAPQTVDKAIANICMDPDTKEVVFLDDPEDGCDLRFFREGKGLNVKYDGSQMKLLKPGPIHEDEGLAQEWLDYIQEHPVPNCLQFYSADHISTVFDGQAGDRDDTEEDEKQPRRSRRDDPPFDEDKPRRTRPTQELDDDDEEVAPAKPAKRMAARDEDEAPRRASRQEEPDADEEAPTTRSGSSIRERLARRHTKEPAEEEE
jgi:hypothetical protein